MELLSMLLFDLPQQSHLLLGSGVGEFAIALAALAGLGVPTFVIVGLVVVWIFANAKNNDD